MMNKKKKKDKANGLTDLKRLAKDLSLKDYVPLTPVLGIEYPADLKDLRNKRHDSNILWESETQSFQALPCKQVQKRSPKSLLQRVLELVWIHCIDLMVIVASLLFASASVYTYFKGMTLPTMRFVDSFVNYLGFFEAFIMMYVGFFLYLFIFKMIVGTTLGTVFLQQDQTVRTLKPQK